MTYDHWKTTEPEPDPPPPASDYEAAQRLITSLADIVGKYIRHGDWDSFCDEMIEWRRIFWMPLDETGDLPDDYAIVLERYNAIRGQFTGPGHKL